MGINALKSHSEKSVRHKELVTQKTLRENFFKKKSSQQCSSGFINQESINSKAQEVQVIEDMSADVIRNSNSTQGTICRHFLDGGKINAEIKWTLKHVVSGYSNNSVNNSLDIFKAMFPDSSIASMMKLDRKKLRYVINFGIAPSFQDILKEEVASSEWFATCFD